ncbi:MAG: hypothetical protein JXR94_05640 [Candidatus Hydrogenedentes bacterium]|nr:hypothetical protein [Candidatus Hydrogenedentota bacterium]
MLTKQTRHIALIVAFLAVIVGVPFAQAVLEVARGERPSVLDLFRRVPSEANLRAFESDLEKTSWFETRTRPWMQLAQFLALEEGGDDAILGREDWWFYRPDVRYLIDAPAKSVTRAGPTDHAAKAAPPADDPVPAIVSFRDQLAARGIHLLVVPAPGKPSVYPEMLTTRAATYPESINPHTIDLIARLRAEGVEVVDLFDVYARATPEDVAWYLSQDSHWAPEGMHLAASAVAQRLIELGWAARGTRSYAGRPAPVERIGDVPAMIQAPWVSRLITPEIAHCVQVVDQATGQPYQDDPQAEILVLGDSFLRIYQTDEPLSAGFIAHLALELHAPMASIVNDGGASTLVRQQLARKPELLAGKKVVVWEFVERDIRFGIEGWQIIQQP